uniref:Tigger transposable element-derived protein 3 n=1 Tax=Bactrocera dorsalis TaxID=27457 RepID=A0A034WIC0_BACDO
MNRSQKQKRRLSLKQKLEIIEAESKNTDRKKLIRKYRCNSSTISRIIKNKNTYIKAAKDGNLFRTRLDSTSNPKLESALCEWFHQQSKLKTSSLNNGALLEKAKEFAIKYDAKYEPCLQWLFRFKKRNGINIPPRRGVKNRQCSKETNETSVDTTSLPMVEICKTELFECNEGMICYADSTSKQLNHTADGPVDVAPVPDAQSVSEPVTTNNTLQVDAAPIDDEPLATEPINTNNKLEESVEDTNAPSISEALQALLVVKQFFILNDMEIGSLFSIEEKILRHWKKNI